MNQFKLTKQNKLEICRDVKNIANKEIKRNGYFEGYIFYDTNLEKFFFSSSINKECNEFYGHVCYTFLEFTQSVTIKSLMKTIFKEDI